MNKTPAEAETFIAELATKVKNPACEVVICAPFVDLDAVVKAAKGSVIKVGAENMHFEDKGAFTGEVSADMLVSMGVEYVIIGHSERREYFAESDCTVNKKTIKALEKGLKPIICVGETLSQRESGITNEFVAMQTKLALKNISKSDAAKVTIAYEPIWAIGTGVTATVEQAEEVCGVIRATLSQIYDDATAQSITIQYGGSMNAKNADDLLKMENIDGGLIGGASLVVDDFCTIINYCG